MATAKLRKTFRYPSDDSDEDETPQALDEEGKMNLEYDGEHDLENCDLEQEKLIQKLRVETEERNEEYVVYLFTVGDEVLGSLMSCL